MAKARSVARVDAAVRAREAELGLPAILEGQRRLDALAAVAQPVRCWVPPPRPAVRALGVYLHNGVWTTRMPTEQGRPAPPRPVRPRPSTGTEGGHLL